MQLWNFNRYRQPSGRSTPPLGTILDRLDDDVLVAILCFCGISEILAASQSCRHLYDLVFSHQVWLAVVRDLHARLFLDLPDDWNATSLSTPSLVDLAKRAVCGPKSWSPRSHTQRSASHQVLPFVRRVGEAVRSQKHKRMPPKIVSSYHIPYPANYQRPSQLLPGGKYVLLSGPRFMCWSLMQNECVWEYAPEYQHHSFNGFQATMTDDGKAVVILIAVFVHLPSKTFLDAVRLDLTTKTYQLLLHLAVPIFWYFDGPLENMKVCSDLAVARYGHNQILVMNLATASHVLLGSERHSNILSVDCIPGYIITIEAESLHSVSNQTFMRVWDINTWPSSDWHYGNSALLLWKMFPKPLIIKAISEGYTIGATLSTYVSPLCPQTYTVWAVVRGRAEQLNLSPAECYTVTKYRLKPDPTTNQISLDYISSRKITVHNNRNYLVGDMSFAGHTRLAPYYPPAKHYIVACRQPSVVRADDIPLDIPSHNSQVVGMSPYSGALTISGVDGVFIHYYE